MKNNENITVSDTGKSAEQIIAEANLGLAIPDEILDTETNESDAPEPEGVAPDAVISGALQIVGFGFDYMGYPNTAAGFSEGYVTAVSPALVAVLQKSAFGNKVLDFLTGTVGKIGAEELALFFAVKPMAIAVWQGYQMDRAAIIEAEEKAKDEPKNQ